MGMKEEVILRYVPISLILILLSTDQLLLLFK